MLRGIIVLIEVALLIILLRSPFVQYWLSDAQTTVSGWISHVATMPERQELDSLRERLAPQIANMSENQKAYLETVLSSKSSLIHFHRLYCQRQEINPYIFGATRTAVCQRIESSQVLHTSD
ncbi:hypothetical protein [Alteromonas oceanisediminis]|uniref:hypothetical protein n=1 Tax=Alteromonas oceanisediminis TaxID=2836180 RepID=UPI001BD9F00C|nr:hypothetical protein [Alteromonas oceanisediminis]MBT0585325.1 hypothetical protein [Alteromonas oceanisediminis]